MDMDKLKIDCRPKLGNARLVLGLTGWMDGGDVSTGAIKHLREKLDAQEFARIEPEGFYLYNFPGSMEISALFRPHVRMKDGVIVSYEPPTNTFFVSEQHNLILFSGREPNLNWEQYADCLFALCRQYGVSQIFFIGSVSGVTPHTRQSPVICSVSDPKLKDLVKGPGIRFSSYEGPASFVTCLNARCPDEGISMTNLVAEIPAYVQGYNPRSIETALRVLSRLLELPLDLDDLREMADEFERKLTEIVQGQPDLAKKVRELEEDYDNEVFDTEMGDLKDWLHQKGIRLD